MPCENNLAFKGTQHYGDPTLIDELEVNLKNWFDWAFLKIGAWQEVNSSTSGIYGGSFSQLLPLDDAGYSDDQVYFGIRKDWVYETGVDYHSPTQTLSYVGYHSGYGRALVQLGQYETSYYNTGDTVNITNDEFSGNYIVYSLIDSTSFLLTDNTNASGAGGSIYGIYNPQLPTIYVDGSENSDCTIDYRNGKVIFDSAQSDVTVTADYSFRGVQTYISNEVSLNYEIQSNSFNPNNTSWSESAESGEYATDPSQRVQLPAVIIEGVAKRSSRGHMLGWGGLRKYQDVLITVVSENAYERNLITDILADQKHKTIGLYDIDVVNKQGKNPLNFDGSLNSSGLTYPDIVNNSAYLWAKAFVDDALVSEVKTNTPNLHMSKVRYRIEVIR